MQQAHATPDPPIRVHGDRPEEFLAFVADLRDATAQGEPVRWACEAGPDGLAALYHLAPPMYLEPEAELAAWRSRHRSGLFYYRRGPGFVVVHDGRSGSDAETVIDDREQLALFDRLSRPGAVPPGLATQALRAAGVLFELGGWAVALPYRLARLTLPTELL
jgi:hypothetical protein